MRRGIFALAASILAVLTVEAAVDPIATRVRWWLSPYRNVGAAAIGTELATLRERGLLSTPETVQTLIGSTLEQVRIVRDGPRPELTHKIAPRVGVIFSFVLDHPWPAGCFFTGPAEAALAHRASFALSQFEKEIYFGALRREAACEGLPLASLIERHFRNTGWILPADLAKPAGRLPWQKRARRYGELRPQDLPFFPNGGSAERPSGNCTGINRFAEFVATNFVFQPRGRRISSAQARLLFDYKALNDPSGAALRNAGFRQRDDGRFEIGGFASLRALTAAFPAHLALAQSTFSSCYVPPNAGIVERLQDKVSRPFGPKGPLPPAPKTPPAEAIDADEFLVAKHRFDRLRSAARRHGTVRTAYTRPGASWHSVMIRESTRRDVLLVLDPSVTFPGRYLHLLLQEDGVYADGWSPEPTRVLLDDATPEPAVSGVFFKPRRSSRDLVPNLIPKPWF